jgi:hypothetical protein
MFLLTLLTILGARGDEETKLLLYIYGADCKYRLKQFQLSLADEMSIAI